MSKKTGIVTGFFKKRYRCFRLYLKRFKRQRLSKKNFCYLKSCIWKLIINRFSKNGLMNTLICVFLNYILYIAFRTILFNNFDAMKQMTIDFLELLKDIQNTFNILIFLAMGEIIDILVLWNNLARILRRYFNTFFVKDSFIWAIDGVLLSFSSFLLMSAIFLNDFAFSLKEMIVLSNAIFPLIVLYLTFLNRFFSMESRKELDEVNTESDKAISNLWMDTIGRGRFVNHVFRSVKELPYKDSFVYGIEGEWGEGKTSVLNLIRNKLKRNDQYIVVDFEPWHFRDQEAILNAFYNEIEYAISQRFIITDLSRILKKYRALILSGLSAGMAVKGFPIDFNKTHENNATIREYKLRIEQLIKQTECKIVIFVDDIDRLEFEELMFVFKLVKLNTDIDNTIFVLSYDYNATKDILINNKVKEKFIEKIIQCRIQLPYISKFKLHKYLEKKIKKLFINFKFSEGESSQYIREFFIKIETIEYDYFNNLRAIKRFFFAVNCSFPQVKQIVHPVDFLIVEIFRIFEHQIYTFIYNTKFLFAPRLEDFFLVGMESKDFYDHVRKMIEKEVGGKKNLIEVLKNIFGSVSRAYGKSKDEIESRKEQRISNSECFDRYFVFQDDDAISDEEIDFWMEKLNQISESNADVVLREMLMKDNAPGHILIFEKLILFSYKLKTNTILDILKFIGKESVIFPIKSDAEKKNFEKLTELYIEFLMNVAIEERYTFLLKEIQKTDNLMFYAKVVNNLRNGMVRDDDIISQDNYANLKRLFLQRIDLVLSNNSVFKIFEETNDELIRDFLQFWVTEWYSSDESIDKANKYLIDLFSKNSKDFLYFIHLYIKDISFWRNNKGVNLFEKKYVPHLCCFNAACKRGIEMKFDDPEDQKKIDDFKSKYFEYIDYIISSIENKKKQNGWEFYYSLNQYFKYVYVDLMLEKGVDITGKDNNEFSLFAAMCHSNDVRVVKKLLLLKKERKIDFKINEFNDRNEKTTALILAASKNNVEVIELLIENGANPDIQNSEGKTALMIAVQENKVESVERLIEHSNVNIEDRNGETPLERACVNDSLDIVKLIVEKDKSGNIINYQSKSGKTALISACICSKARIVKHLIKHGADPDLKGENDKTALMYAVCSNSQEIVNILIPCVKNIECKDNSGKSALDYAEENNYIAIAGKLREAIKNRSIDKSRT